MILALSISILTCLLIILAIVLFPQIKVGKKQIDSYWVAALLGAALLITTGSISLPYLTEKLMQSSAVNPIKLLVLFISMTGISVFLDEVGFFSYIAQLMLEKARTSQKTLFIYLYVTVAVLTVFTSNDIIVLTLTPFICYFAKNANISPIPFLVAEFVAANTWSMMLIIGNPTNIYLASAFGIGFGEYFRTMALPTVIGGTVSLLVLYLIFRKQLTVEIAPVKCVHKTENRELVVMGLVHLAICTVLLAISSYIQLEMWIVAFICLISLMLCLGVDGILHKRKPIYILRILKRLPWQLVPFVISMFTIVLTLSSYGVTDKICSFLGENHTVFNYGITSYLSANLINNIPMSVLYCPVLEGLEQTALQGGIYATIAGSNIGAFLTPIGALAGIMWTAILKKSRIKFSFLSFMKYGTMVSVPTILAVIMCIGIEMY